ncbi:MAG: hypothetical protein ACHQIM_19755, partial [Sphingobacteriales bacterium]
MIKSLKFLLIAIAAMALFSSSAQKTDTIKIIGHIEHNAPLPPELQVMLAPYKPGMDYHQTKVNDQDAFVIPVAIKEPGFYEIRLAGVRKSLILSPGEPVVQFIMKVQGNSIVFVGTIGSRENAAYDEFCNVHYPVLDSLKNLKKNCATNEKLCRAALQKQAEASNQMVAALQIKYLGTYTANALSSLGRMYSPWDTTPCIEQMREHFFDYVNISDPLVYNAPDFKKNLTTYLDYLADTSAVARVHMVEQLYEKTKGKREAQKDFLLFLLDVFTVRKTEDYIMTVVQ